LISNRTTSEKEKKRKEHEIEMKDFTFIQSKNEREMIESAYKAITIGEKWEVLRTIAPNPNTGFMFTRVPQLEEVTALVTQRYSGHSGSSLGWTMQMMRIIAKEGVDGLREKWENQ